MKMVDNLKRFIGRIGHRFDAEDVVVCVDGSDHARTYGGGYIMGREVGEKYIVAAAWYCLNEKRNLVVVVPYSEANLSQRTRDIWGGMGGLPEDRFRLAQ